ncbi:MAG: hypothetical protein RR185_08070 [Angelakisella sp.]
MNSKATFLATERIAGQMNPYEKGQAERRAGRLMQKLCEANPQAAELIAQDLLVEKMNLAAVTEKVRDAAKKQAQKNHLNECEFDDEDYLEIICEFYGIGGELHPVETEVKPATNPKKVISFMDLL